MTGEPVELTLNEQAACLTPPYQRLLGDAMRGDGELFGRRISSTRNGGSSSPSLPILHRAKSTNPEHGDRRRRKP